MNRLMRFPSAVAREPGHEPDRHPRLSRPYEPPIEEFRTRTWRVRPDGTPDAIEIAWFMPVGFRSVASRLQVVGQIEIVESDPKDSAVYRGWRGIGEPGSSRP